MLQLPRYLTAAKQTTNAPSGSESTTFDYSGADEILKRQGQATTLEAARQKDLYDGKISDGLEKGKVIRGLIASLNSIQPVRIASHSSSSDMGGGSTQIQGGDEEPSLDPTKNTKNPANKQGAFGA